MPYSPVPADPDAPAVRAAAIQFAGVVGDVGANLAALEPLIDQAAAAGAELIAVPEFFTSPLPLADTTFTAVLPPDNPAVDLLRAAAARHGARIGGSMLIADRGQVYNRYHLVEPDGTIHHHDKDLPTMWENAFYAPGADPGVLDTGIGPLGAAVCWELIRTQTARRLRAGGVGAVMTGTHWWTVPENWGPVTGRALAPLAQYNRYLSENAPTELARRIGAPVIQASHCGPLRTDLLLAPGSGIAAPYVTRFVGATQIVDADGCVLAARNTAEGPGVVVADIRIGARTPAVTTGDRFWIPELPWAIRAYWWQQNLAARSYYRRRGRARGLAAAAACRRPARA